MIVKLYSGVLFKNSYSDVLMFDNPVSRETYLNTFLKASFTTNVYNNEKYIDVSKDNYNESINYVLIIDDTQVHNYKYYFVNTSERVSASTYRLNLICDIWQTYVLRYNSLTRSFEKPTLKNSLMIQAHDVATNTDPQQSVVPYNGTKNTTFYNMLPSECNGSLNAGTKGTLIYLCIDDKGTQFILFFNSATTTITTSTFDVPYSVTLNTIYDINRYVESKKIYGGGEYTDFNFNFYACYFLPFNVNLNNTYAQRVGSLKQSGKGDLSAWYSYDIVRSFTICENSNIITNPNLKYEIGLYNTRYNLTSDNLIHSVKLEYRQSISMFNVYLIIDNSKIIDLTQEYSMPIITDNYSDYWLQNQYSIKASYITSGVNAIFNANSIASNSAKGAAMSYASGNYAGMISNIAGGFEGVAGVGVGLATEMYSKYAMYQDLKNQPDTIASPITNAFNNILKGFGYYTSMAFNNSDIVDAQNYYGVMFTKYTAMQTPLLQDSNYNFRFWRYSGLNIQIDTNYDIKNKIENIFNNGVRIWYDSDNYLTNCNYLKEEETTEV